MIPTAVSRGRTMPSKPARALAIRLLLEVTESPKLVQTLTKRGGKRIEELTAVHASSVARIMNSRRLGPLRRYGGRQAWSDAEREEKKYVHQRHESCALRVD